MFKVSAAAFYCIEDGNNVGIPLFTRDKLNSYYVCETDNYFHIQSFYKFSDVDQYAVYGVGSDSNFSVGDQMPIIIRYSDGSLSLVSYEYCADNFELLTNSSTEIFAYNLGTILGVEHKNQLEVLTSISMKYFSSEYGGKRWLDIELATAQSDQEFWKLYHSKKGNDSDFLRTVTGSSDIHDALRWLMADRSVTSKNWYPVWKIAHDSIPYEKLIHVAAVRWVSNRYTLYNPADALNDSEFTEVICSVVEDGEYLDQVGDIVQELISEEPTSAVVFVRSLSSYRTLHRMLADLQAWDAMAAIEKVAIFKRYVP